MNYNLGDIHVDLNDMTQVRANRGFTIVELLIVIVIIAILAAITIVAYNGITGRTRSASAKTTASAILKKAHAHNAEKGTYPAISTDLTGATSTTYYVAPGTVTFVAPMGTTAPSSPASLTFYKCGTGSTIAAPTTLPANITTVTGVRLDYFDFGSNTTASMTAGVVNSGTVGTYNVGCIVNN